MVKSLLQCIVDKLAGDHLGPMTYSNLTDVGKAGYYGRFHRAMHAAGLDFQLSQSIDDEEAGLAMKPTPDFLRDLAERLRSVPGTYGIDDGDIDSLRSLADELQGVFGNYNIGTL